ncbi:MAG: hypothetical protein GY797_07940 [Deltaproteobacteria bacterium]|nr:hypothetical protein [Deltaproteobacteria bacterium]MCP5007164.1 hypothetical protein [Planctomycetota bacterium]
MEKHTKIIGHEKSCNKGPFKRLRYFYGMMLDEKKLKLEQDYHREKQKLHNRIHGFGVVWGLDVSITPDDKCNNGITIGHGFALDCEGNEIVVCDERKICLEELVKIIRGENKCAEINGEYCIGIKYCDFESDPVTQYITSCDTDNLQQVNSLVREGYRIVVMKKEDFKELKEEKCGRPCDYCEGVVPPWCKEDNHIIILGCVKIRKKGEEETSDDGTEQTKPPGVRKISIDEKELTIDNCESDDDCCKRLEFPINLPEPKPCEEETQSGEEDNTEEGTIFPEQADTTNEQQAKRAKAKKTEAEKANTKKTSAQNGK